MIYFVGVEEEPLVEVEAENPDAALLAYFNEWQDWMDADYGEGLRGCSCTAYAYQGVTWCSGDTTTCDGDGGCLSWCEDHPGGHSLVDYERRWTFHGLVTWDDNAENITWTPDEDDEGGDHADGT